MIYNLTEKYSLASDIITQIRDKKIQKNRSRFRKNLERLGEIIAYEISKKLPSSKKIIETPLAKAKCKVLSEQPILATILRAGIPMHIGLLNYFEDADSIFVSAYRKHDKDGRIDIVLDYAAGPPVRDRILIISDPMLATGSSLVVVLNKLFEKGKGKPSQIHIVCAIASKQGIRNVQKHFPTATIWAAAIDDKLNDKAYIVPGLGDAGDLAYGKSKQ